MCTKNVSTRERDLQPFAAASALRFNGAAVHHGGSHIRTHGRRTERSRFNRAAVHHGGSPPVGDGDSARLRASTGPPFITADRTTRRFVAMPSRRRASTGPPFITADRRTTRARTSFSSTASTGPPFITADRARPMRRWQGQGNRWASTGRRSSRRIAWAYRQRAQSSSHAASTGPPFITADRAPDFLREDARVLPLQLGCRSSRRIAPRPARASSRPPLLQLGRRSSRRIASSSLTKPSLSSSLQLGRRSSRRIAHPTWDPRAEGPRGGFNGAAVHHGGSHA